MNILIIGCGSAGAALAARLDKGGHDVSVIDKSEYSFDALPPDFSGFTTTGVPIDGDILKRAGIGTCDALFAVTDEDDMNIMCAQLAKRVYGIERVFARVSDISKGEIFEQLGIRILCPTRLTVSAACDALGEDGADIDRVNFEEHTVRFSTIPLPEQLEDETPDDIEYESGETLFGVIRDGSGLILYRGQPITFVPGDRLIFAQKV